MRAAMEISNTFYLPRKLYQMSGICDKAALNTMPQAYHREKKIYEIRAT